MKTIVQNIATEYQDEGDASVILFLHGWQANLHTFDAIASILKKENRVIRMDLPGFGESEFPKGDWSLDDYVEFVRDFIDKLGVSVDVIVGHSFGGRIAIKGQAENILHARKLVLIASAGVSKNRNFRNSLLKVIAKIGGMATFIPPLVFWRDKIRERLYNIVGGDYSDAGPLKKTFLKIIKEDLSTAASQITTPTLLIWGTDDTETPLADGQRLSRLIPNSKLEIINGAGHLIHREKPNDVAGLIQNFI